MDHNSSKNAKIRNFKGKLVCFFRALFGGKHTNRTNQQNQINSQAESSRQISYRVNTNNSSKKASSSFGKTNQSPTLNSKYSSKLENNGTIFMSPNSKQNSPDVISNNGSPSKFSTNVCKLQTVEIKSVPVNKTFNDQLNNKLFGKEKTLLFYTNVNANIIKKCIDNINNTKCDGNSAKQDVESSNQVKNHSVLVSVSNYSAASSFVEQEVDKNKLSKIPIDQCGPGMVMGRHISYRDQARLRERKNKYQQAKERRRTKNGNNNIKNNTCGNLSSVVSSNINENSQLDLSLSAKTQLPVGARGFVTEINRPNRFALQYVPRGQMGNVKREHFENLFEKLGEMNANVETLMHSYNNIVKSLIDLQLPAGKRDQMLKRFFTTEKLNSRSVSSPNKSSNIDDALKQLELSKFVNSNTKHDAYQQLFELVEEMNISLDEIHVYYDDLDGTFDFNEYLESEFLISYNSLNICLDRVRKLNSIIQKVLSFYSHQLIDMFKLN